MSAHNNLNFSKWEIKAKRKGYRVTKKGDLIGPNGLKLKCEKKNKGYKFFTMKVDKVSKNVFVHRLQAYQKFGNLIYKNNMQVRHLDNKRDNNSIENISIGHNRTNMLDRPKEDLLKSALHATSFTKKYDHEKIKAYHNETKSYRKTMDKFNIKSPGSLHYIINKKWKHNT